MRKALRTRLVLTNFKPPLSRSPRSLSSPGSVLSLYYFGGGFSLYARQALFKIKLYPVCGLPPSPRPQLPAMVHRTCLQGFLRV